MIFSSLLISCSREDSFLISYNNSSTDLDVSDISEGDSYDVAEENVIDDDILYSSKGVRIYDDSIGKIVEYDAICDFSNKLGGSMMKLDRDRRS